MAKLQKFTLSHDKKQDDWKLTNDGTDRVVRRFDMKADATKGGVLERVVGDAGGSVKIEKMNGRYQEERTYPREKDPSKSPG